MARPRQPMKEKVYGYLTVLDPLSRPVECRCICGKLTAVRAYNLQRGDTKSCGCKRHKHSKYGSYDMNGVCGQRLRFVRRRRAFLKAKGLCVVCGKAPAKPGVLCCSPCHERNRARFKAYYKKHKNDGFCFQCRKPAKPGTPRCARCRKRHNRIRAQNRQAWIAKGICSRCGKRPARKGGPRCQVCYDKADNIYRRSAGTVGRIQARRSKRLQDVLAAYGLQEGTAEAQWVEEHLELFHDKCDTPTYRAMSIEGSNGKALNLIENIATENQYE